MTTKETPVASAPPIPAFWIGVHVLSQFVFCPRAGINAFENPQDFDDGNEEEARLGAMPDFSLALLKEAFQSAGFKAFLFGIVAGGCLVVAYTIRAYGLAPFVSFGIGGMLCMGATFFYAERAVQSLLQIRSLENATAKEPDPTSEVPMAIHWGEMLKAGFEPQWDRERLVHEPEMLKGTPYLVLRRNGVQIPVIIMPESSVKVHDKYRVRIAAYCHLLQAAALASSPYGIVLKANSYEGETVPVTALLRQFFHGELKKARRFIAEWRTERKAPSPPAPALCSGCPFGEPKPVGGDESAHSQMRISMPMVILSDGNLQTRHSECGDRFNWVAPHEKTISLSLKRIV